MLFPIEVLVMDSKLYLNPICFTYRYNGCGERQCIWLWFAARCRSIT